MRAVELGKGMLISELMLKVVPSISAESEQIIMPRTACRQGTLHIMLVLDVGYIGAMFYLESPEFYYKFSNARHLQI